MRHRDGRRRNAAEFQACEICKDTVWTSRIKDHSICLACERIWYERQRRAAQAAEDMRRGELRDRGYESDLIENPLSPRPGWEELENVESTIADRRLDLDALWRAVGQGDNKEALLLLDEGWETEGLTEVWIVAVPDDFLGDHYRIWVR